MTKTTKTKRKAPRKPVDAIGVTITRLASLAGVHRTTAQDWTRQEGFPSKFPDGSHNPFKVGAWRAERRLAGAVDPAEGEAMLQGDSSPNLERFRAARAKLAELELEERRRNLVALPEIHEVLCAISKLIRDAGDTLGRQFGDPARAILNRALDQADIKIDELVGTPDEDDGADENA